MLNHFRYLIKRNVSLNSQILKIKFFFEYGIEDEAKFIHENYNFNNTVDIGSNSGHFTNILSKISNNVYSFEPIDYLYRAQKKNFKKKNIKVFNCALGNKTCKKVFYIAKNNDPESSFLVKHKNSKKKIIKVFTGDSIIKRNQIDFIKIDVEGFELNVLNGLKKTIDRNRSLLLVEIEKRHNPDFIKVFNFFKKRNYKIYFLNKKESKLKPIPYNKINKFINKNQKIKLLGTENYINNFFFQFKNNYLLENK